MSYNSPVYYHNPQSRWWSPNNAGIVGKTMCQVVIVRLLMVIMMKLKIFSITCPRQQHALSHLISKTLYMMANPREPPFRRSHMFRPYLKHWSPKALNFSFKKNLHTVPFNISSPNVSYPCAMNLDFLSNYPKPISRLVLWMFSYFLFTVEKLFCSAVILPFSNSLLPIAFVWGLFVTYSGR